MKSAKFASLADDLLLTIAPFLDARGLIHLSQVCRHWRNTFLSHPNIWSKIVYPDLTIPLVKMILSRSAGCPLQVHFIIPQRHDPSQVLDYCDIIFAHIHRIETLTFSKGDWSRHEQTLDYIFSFFKQPAPKLKVFRFSQDEYSDCLSNQVPEDFLYQTAPELEELGFSYLTISHKMPIFKSITRLTLKDVAGITSLVQLFDILQVASNNLTVLNLGNLIDLPWDLNVHELDGRSTQFSSLQSLSLELYPHILMIVLDHMCVPSNIDWEIESPEGIEGPELDITPLLRFLKQVRTGTSYPKLCLDFSRKEMQISFGETTTPPYNGSLKIWMAVYQDSTNRLETLFATLGFSDVTCCKICISFGPHSATHWLVKFTNRLGSLFSFFGGLRELLICSKVNDSLWVLDQLRPEQTLPCPLLTDLTLDSVSMNDKRWIRILEERKAAGNILTNIQAVVTPYDSAAQRELGTLARNVTCLKDTTRAPSVGGSQWYKGAQLSDPNRTAGSVLF